MNKISLPDRAAAVQTIQQTIAPILNITGYAVRPIYNDVVVSYDRIDGVGQPDNFRVDGNALWEQEAVDAYNALLTAAQTFHDYFISYGFPDNPANAAPAQPVTPVQP
jgi:hypothetical protein